MATACLVKAENQSKRTSGSAHWRLLGRTGPAHSVEFLQASVGSTRNANELAEQVLDIQALLR